MGIEETRLRLLRKFADQCQERLITLSNQLVELEGGGGDPEVLRDMRRELHTLKGGARMAGITPMGDLSHASESLLTGFVEGRIEPDGTLFDVLNDAVDRLAGMLDAVRG